MHCNSRMYAPCPLCACKHTSCCFIPWPPELATVGTPKSSSRASHPSRTSTALRWPPLAPSCQAIAAELWILIQSSECCNRVLSVATEFWVLQQSSECCNRVLSVATENFACCVTLSSAAQGQYVDASCTTRDCACFCTWGMQRAVHETNQVYLRFFPSFSACVSWSFALPARTNHMLMMHVYADVNDPCMYVCIHTRTYICIYYVHTYTHIKCAVFALLLCACNKHIYARKCTHKAVSRFELLLISSICRRGHTSVLPFALGPRLAFALVLPACLQPRYQIKPQSF